MADSQELSWPDVIRTIAKQEGMNPALALAVAEQESGFNPSMKGKAGEIGLFQLMEGTAKDLKVDRDNPIQNIRGGIRYLKQQLDANGGDLDKALGAYNAGPGHTSPDYAAAVVQRLPKFKTPVQTHDTTQKQATTQPDQPKATEPEDYWGGFRKGWEEGGLGGFKGYVNAFAGAPRRAYEGIGALVEGLSTDPGQTVINAARGLAAVPGQIIQATREAGTNPEGFGRAIGEPISDALLATQAPKVPGIAARAALHHVLPGGVRPIIRGVQVLRDIGQAMGETGEAAAEAPKTAPVRPGPGPGGRGWYQPWEGAERERIVAGKATPAPEPIAAPTETAPTPSSGQPPLTKVWVAMNKLNTRLKATELPRATALVKDGMDPAEAVRKVVAERGGGSAAEELAKQLGTPSDAEVAADMGKRARSGQKSLMAKYGDQ